MNDGEEEILKPEPQGDAAKKEKEIPTNLGRVQRIRIFIGKGLSALFLKRKSKLRAKICGGISAFFSTVGGIMFKVHHIPPWLAISSFAFGLIWLVPSTWQCLVNNGSTNKCARFCSGFVLVLVSACIAFAFFMEYRPEAKSHLGLFARESMDENFIISLNNSYLKFTDSEAAINISDTNGWLEIPVGNNSNKVIAELALWFNGPKDVLEMAEVLLIILPLDSWDTNIDPANPEVRWGTAMPQSGEVIPKILTFTFKDLNSNHVKTLPRIEFDASKGTNITWKVFLRVQPKGEPMQLWAFSIRFVTPHDAGVTGGRPFVHLGPNFIPRVREDGILAMERLMTNRPGMNILVNPSPSAFDAWRRHNLSNADALHK